VVVASEIVGRPTVVTGSQTFHGASLRLSSAASTTRPDTTPTYPPTPRSFASNALTVFGGVEITHDKEVPVVIARSRNPCAQPLDLQHARRPEPELQSANWLKPRRPIVT